MLSKGFLKAEISIKNIGRKTFLVGILLGLIASWIINLFYNYSRESIRTITLLNDLTIFTDKVYRFYDLFFASLSVIFGFSITTIYWFQPKRNGIFVRRNYLKLSIYTNANLFMILPLALVWRYASIMAFVYQSYWDFDRYFSIHRDYKLLIIIIPVYLFFTSWMYIQRYYRAWKWMIISLPILLTIIFFQWHFIRVDRSILNGYFHKMHKADFEYINNQMESAKKEGVTFNYEAIKVLKSYSISVSKAQIDSIKSAFKDINHCISLDTIILQKILVHNLKCASDYKYWPYATPISIYAQIIKHDSSSLTTKHLIEILKYEGEIVRKSEQSPPRERYQYDYSFLNDDFTRIIIGTQLNLVKEYLDSDPMYSKFSNSLDTFSLANKEKFLVKGLNSYIKEIKTTGTNK